MKQGSKKIIAIVSDRKDAKHSAKTLGKYKTCYKMDYLVSCGAELSEDIEWLL